MWPFKKMNSKSTSHNKILIIVRHSKANWDYDELNDYNRPLTEIGKEKAVLIGKLIKEKQHDSPSLIITSSAKRAYSTALLIAQQVGYDSDNIDKHEDLYLAWSPDIIKKIYSLPGEVESCIIVGHNPGLTDLINNLGVRLDYLPTASAVCFTFNTSKWSKISATNATLKWFQQSSNLK